jgi:type IV pilus assembly protein PilC
MLAFVLPRFVGLYQGKEHLLPLPTKILLALSHFLTHQWMYLVPASLIGAYLGIQWFNSPAGQKVWHRVQLSIPLVGPMYRKLHLSRGLRVIGTLLGAGVSLVDCLETAKSLANHGRYAAMWETVAYQIQQGNPFSETLRSCDLAPPAIAQMIHSGETGGRLSAVTERVAEHAEAELKETITEVTRYIEPAMIVLMGGLIGGLTLSLLLPVFTVSRVMTQ